MSLWDAHLETLSTKRSESVNLHKLYQNSAANWDEQLIFAGRGAETNEQHNLTSLFVITPWNAFCMTFLCFISDVVLLWRILEEGQVGTRNVQTFNERKFPIEN